VPEASRQVNAGRRHEAGSPQSFGGSDPARRFRQARPALRRYRRVGATAMSAFASRLTVMRSRGNRLRSTFAARSTCIVESVKTVGAVMGDGEDAGRLAVIERPESTITTP